MLVLAVLLSCSRSSVVVPAPIEYPSFGSMSRDLSVLLGQTPASNKHLPLELRSFSDHELREYAERLRYTEHLKFDVQRSLRDFEERRDVFWLDRIIMLLTNGGERARSALRNLGHALIELGEYEDAEVILQANVFEYEAARRAGETSSQICGGLKETHKCLHELFMRTRRYSQAVQSMEQAVKAARGTGADNMHGLSGLADCLQALGRLYLQFGDSDAAIDKLHECLTVEAQLPNRNNTVAGLAKEAIGDWHAKAGQIDDAIVAYSESLELLDQDPLTHKLRMGNRGDVHVKLGDTLMKNDHYEEAITHYEEAILDYERDPYWIGGPRSGVAIAQARIALAEKTRSDSTAWRAAANQSLNTWAGVEHELAYEDLVARAELRFILGETAQAEEDLQRALELVRQVAFQFDWASRLQAGSLNALHTIGAKLVASMIEAGAVEEAFQLTQSVKSLPLIELLASGQIASEDPRVSAAYRDYWQLMAEVHKLDDEIKNILIEIEEASLGEGEKQALVQLWVESARSKRNKLRQEAASLRAELAERDASLLGFLTDELPASSSVQVRDEVLGSNTVLIEYLLTSDAVIVFVVAGSAETAAYVIPLGSELRRKVADRKYWDDLCWNVLNRPREYRGNPANDAAKHLYELLIDPIAEHLIAVTHVIICPDGPLYTVPFDVLVDGEDNLMLAKHALSYSASATMLTLIRKATDNQGALVAGLSFDNKPIAGSGAASPDRQCLERLKYATAEAVEVAGLLGCAPALDDAVTEDWLISTMGDYETVHIATHGRLSAVPLMSGFYIAHPDKSSEYKDASM